MTLGEKQRLMTRLLPRLLDFAHGKGYEVTLGDAYRSPRVFGEFGIKAGYGARHSQHKQRCAIDLNLHRGKVYLRNTSDHAELGAFWKSLHPLCRWGGDWGDGNHYSIEHEGYA